MGINKCTFQRGIPLLKLLIFDKICIYCYNKNLGAQRYISSFEHIFNERNCSRNKGIIEYITYI